MCSVEQKRSRAAAYSTVIVLDLYLYLTPTPASTPGLRMSSCRTVLVAPALRRKTVVDIVDRADFGEGINHS
jgi:hypothetical protein